MSTRTRHLLGLTVVLSLLGGCSQAAPTSSAPASPLVSSATTPSPSPSAISTSSTPTPSIDAKEMIRLGEAAVKADLPRVPLWKGTTFKGVLLDDSTVCVDRYWGPGGGIGSKDKA